MSYISNSEKQRMNKKILYIIVGSIYTVGWVNMIIIDTT